MFSPIDPHACITRRTCCSKLRMAGTLANHQPRPDAAENPGTPASVGHAHHQERVDKQRGVIYALAPSFKNVNTIWAGTDDGLVWITRDGGRNWANVTPPN